MFDFIQNHKKLVQIVLAVLFLPFAFFGLGSYFSGMGVGNDIAKVGDQRITPQEFTNALTQRQDQLRKILGDKVDPVQLDSAELRAAVLDDLIRQRLLIDRAVHAGVMVPDRILQQLIAAEAAFQEEGKFSNTRYEELLKRQGLTPAGFESGLRRELMLQRLSDAYRITPVVPDTVIDRVLQINAQQRETTFVLLRPEQFLAQVKLAPDAAQQYYDSHQNEFQLPEQVRLDYVVLAIDAVAADVPVSADDVREYYEQNTTQYAQGEQRRASHILITVDPAADAATKQAARAKAEQLLKEARAHPAAFADLARKNSQDPGSAAKGGDLGFFPRGAMVKAFDAAVFAMKPGEFVGPIETQYGYHIIRLTEVKGRGFDEVRPQVEADLKRRQASQKFAELADQLNNLAFEQSDSLQGVATALKVKIQRSDWVGRSSATEPLFDNEKLRKAVFSDDVLKNKRNSEVIDVGNNQLVVARVAEYQPARARPFAEVSAGITQQLLSKQAATLTAQQGRTLLDQLKRGESTGMAWGPSRLISRSTPGMPPTLLTALFKADVSQLPAYIGVESPQGGYILFKITKVVEGEGVSDSQRASLGKQLRQLTGQEELNAYVAALKLKADVKVTQGQVEESKAP